jgi:hypothetical protein
VNRPARRSGVVEHELGEELLLYEPQTQQVVGCDRFARRVWRLVDGERSPLGIAESIAQQLDQPLPTAFAQVEAVLQRLVDERVIEQREQPFSPAADRTLPDRRIALAFDGERFEVGAWSVEALEMVRRALGGLEVPTGRDGFTSFELRPESEHVALLRDGERVSVTASLEAAVRSLEGEIVRSLVAGRTDLLWLHAGAVGSRGRAVLVVGVPSRGKSTLVAGLHRRGWSYLSDEFVAVDPRTFEALAFPRTPVIRTPTRELLTEEEARRMSRTEVVLDRRRVQHGRLQIGAIVFPHYVRGVSARLEAKGAAGAVVSLLENARSFGRNGEHDILTAVRLVREVFQVSLPFGQPEAAVELVDRASANWWLD